MKKELTCIACPLGCTVTVTLKGKEIISVEGNTCPRGKEYAITECIAPVRTVTTTVKCTDGSLVAVKTARPIPKDKMMEAMRIINYTVATLPISVGDVIIEELFGSSVVATAEKQ
ncbi:MAG: DUF1667 domain-containing protein [Clostridia bacterium]|nr:DUF1667 domain-containing protein [Clostridia bacterium]